MTLDILNRFLSSLFNNDNDEVLRLLEVECTNEITDSLIAMLRTAIQRPGQPPLYYRQLANLWQRLNRPSLKPNLALSNMVFIADSTIEGASLFLELFCASYGVSLNIGLSAFDSVEQQVLAPDNQLNINGSSIVVLMLSEQWLRRYLGSTTLIERQKLITVKELLKTIFDALKSRNPARILIGNFPSRAFITAGGSVVLENHLGWSQAVTHLNDWLSTEVSDVLSILDIAEAISLAGGSRALGRLSYFRAHIPFEEQGMITVSREIATAIANISGKNHRALLTDWDNTLWGGEVGELGLLGVNSSIDNPDGLAYQLLQSYLRDLKKLGILLAAVSRNDPSVVQILDKNADVLLEKNDFASIQIHWGSKSKSISEVIKDLSFGSEFMVFIDDSPFELAEVLSAHPYIDVIHAKTPDDTLAYLCNGRYFNIVTLSESDQARHDRQLIIRQQNEFHASFSSTEDFLQSLNIQLSVSNLNENNEMRVIQMFQKTNQFNLTTHRYQIADLYKLKEMSARFGVFSYEDNFGSQGIIAVVILIIEETKIRIDSWLMSCRVLNRGIENAIFNWIIDIAGEKTILGRYVQTQKNALVQDLYERLGFYQIPSNDDLSSDNSNEKTNWAFNPTKTKKPALLMELIIA